MYLSRYTLPQNTFFSGADEWHKIADKFDKQWNFPNAPGAIDGKCLIQKHLTKIIKTFFTDHKK